MTGRTSESLSFLRVEDASLLAGEGAFVDDIHRDRMAHAVFVRSPFAHAKIRSINVEPAREAGALAVLVASDLPFIDKRLIARYWHPSIRKVLPTFLAVDRVRFVGEPVALVVAEDRYQAEDLAELVEVDYEPIETVATPAAAQAASAIELHPEWPRNVAAEFQHKIGDAEAALSRAPRRITRRFSFRRQGGLPLETRGCVADFEVGGQALTIWLSTQTHYAVRANLAEILGLPEYNVRVKTGDVGGGFGAKSRPYSEEIVVSHASRVLRRPVKWIEDRLEHMQATTQSRGITTELELGYDKDGRMLALKGRLVVDVGAYVFTSGIITAEVAASHCCGPYKIRDVCVDVVCVGTNKTPLATCRGAGQPEATFPLEYLIDAIARDIGRPASEIRLRNIIAPADMPYDPSISYGGAKSAFESGDFPRMLERTVVDSGYSEVVETGPRRERIAWGLACGIESTGLVNFESARVQVDAGGNVLLTSGLTSQGQGQRTALRRVCAETLGVSEERVTVELGDTELLSFGRGTFASRGAIMGANAVAGAAAGVRGKVLACAGQLLQCTPDVLDISNGQIVRGDGAATHLMLKDIVQALQPNGPLYSGAPTLEETFIYDSKNRITLALSIHAAKVSVDVTNGICRLLDYYIMHDAGRMLDPKIVEGQIVGGAVEGIGCALLSEFVHDDQAQLLTGSLADYLLITAPEAPRIRLAHMETRASTNPLGVRGVGEGGTIAAPAAVANAILRAIGPLGIAAEQELLTLPIKPETVLRALAER
jgi:carbon-monoxide dehydrogenase large subunit